MTIAEEIEVYAQGCVHPFERGGLVDVRVVIEHRRYGCDWSVSFQSRPDSIVSWPRLQAEAEQHAVECPLTGADEADRRSNG